MFVRIRVSRLVVLALGAVLALSGRCVPPQGSAGAAGGDAVASRSTTTSAPLGSPLDITYKFVVANDAQFERGLPRHGRTSSTPTRS